MSSNSSSRLRESHNRTALGLVMSSVLPLAVAALLVLAVQLADRRIAIIPLAGGVEPASVSIARAGSGARQASLSLGNGFDDAEKGVHRFVRVTVTGYTSVVEQTDDTPFLTATLSPTRPGTLALSRDLLRTFTRGAPFDFGDRVLIPGMGIYVVEDTMHPRWARRADIWFADNETAWRWGRRQVYLALVDAEEPVLVAAQWHPESDL